MATFKDQNELAAVVAELIAAKGWSTIDLVGGTPQMTKDLFVESKRYGFELEISDLTEEKKKEYEAASKRLEQLYGDSWKKEAPKKEIAPEEKQEETFFGGAMGGDEGEEPPIPSIADTATLQKSKGQTPPAEDTSGKTTTEK